MTEAEEQTLRRVGQWAGLAASAAATHRLDRTLVLAVICEESRGNPAAVKVERGFFTRYLDGLIALVRRTVSKRDDHWLRYPDVFAASYGLMQVLYPVALERGLELEYPTELCIPAIGVEAGCRQLAWCFGRVLAFTPAVEPERTRRALLRYNGGGDRAYPDRVLRWADLLRGNDVAGQGVSA